MRTFLLQIVQDWYDAVLPSLTQFFFFLFLPFLFYLITMKRYSAIKWDKKEYIYIRLLFVLYFRQDYIPFFIKLWNFILLSWHFILYFFLFVTLVLVDIAYQSRSSTFELELFDYCFMKFSRIQEICNLFSIYYEQNLFMRNFLKKYIEIWRILLTISRMKYHPGVCLQPDYSLKTYIFLRITTFKAIGLPEIIFSLSK